METKQALQLIKQALDDATAQGSYKNLDYINAIITAYNVVAEEINKEDKNVKKVNQ
jgi:hypothetical protein